jgi:uncharacterized protein (TIGR02217 family)
MSAFDDARLPVDIEVGAEGGPTFSTGIVTMANGTEQRTQNWSRAKSTYTIGYGISETDWQAVRAFFYARRGRARGFRFKDWTDYVADLEPVLVDNGHMFLAKTYKDDTGLTYIRRITRPVPGTLELFAADGVTNVTSSYTESYGLLSGPSAPLLASFEFDIPMRFDVDEFSLTHETIKAATVGNLNLIELIEDSLKLNGM